MSYSATINYLYNLQKHGIKFGLENISRLMSLFDKPHESFLSVHVAGTNGKGSVSAIIASVLRTVGLKVGLFTSPHIVSFTERIRINDEEITENDVIGLTEEIREKISKFEIRNSKFSPTFFEVVTAIALLYFKRKKVDIAVIEVGMGGRLDATNIITPEVSVITNISYDHREFLGSTLKEIAHEKAGIIKDGVPVVVSYQEPEAMEVIERKAIEKGARPYVYGRDFSSALRREDLSGICFEYWSGDSQFAIPDLVLPLIGEHQMQNASVAIKAVELINERRLKPAAIRQSEAFMSYSETKGKEDNPSSPPFSKEGKGGFLFEKIILNFIREGLENVRWPGRLEIVKEDPLILIDGAHNPAAAGALSKAFKKLFLRKYGKIIIVLGIMSDKDVRGIMEPLLPFASEIILTSPEYSRAASPEKLASTAASLGFFNVRIALTVKDAIEMAIKDSYKLQVTSYKLKNNKNSKLNSSLILVTGSFYTIGEAKEALGVKGILAKLRE